MSGKNTIFTRRKDSQSEVKGKNLREKNFISLFLEKLRRSDQNEKNNIKRDIVLGSEKKSMSRNNFQRTNRQSEAEKKNTKQNAKQNQEEELFINSKPLRVTLIALAAIVVVGMGVYKIPRIRNFEVSGNTASTKEEIVDACGVIYDQHIFETDLNAVKLNLESYAQYRNVKIEYKFPVTLHLSMVESEADARISKDNKDIVIDRNGMVIKFGQVEEKRNIPQVLGISVSGYKEGEQLSISDEYQLWVLKQTLQILYNNGYEDKYALIDLSNTVNIKMMNYQRITVCFGELDKLEDKLKRADNFLTELENENITGGVLDVSSKQITYRPIAGNGIFVPEEWSEWLAPEINAVNMNNSNTIDDYAGKYIIQDPNSNTARPNDDDDTDDANNTDAAYAAEDEGNNGQTEYANQFELDPEPEMTVEPRPTQKPKSSNKTQSQSSSASNKQDSSDPFAALGIPDELG